MTEPQDFHRQGVGQHRFAPHLNTDATPGWSEGIRALYDAVVQEPLPADLQKLLHELGEKSRR